MSQVFATFFTLLMASATALFLYGQGRLTRSPFTVIGLVGGTALILREVWR